MRAEEFLNFLEKEKLKSTIYKRLKWKEGYVPKSSEELKALIYEFGKQRIIWWMPSVADCAKGKRFAKGQVVLALFFTGLSLCCLSKEYRLTSALCLMALSCYIGCSFLLHVRYIRDYVDIYKGGIMPFLSYMEAEECVEEDYIESIKGIVRSAEFSMHVHYLLEMKDKGYKDEDGIYHIAFNCYAWKLRNSSKFKTELEKSVVEKFLSYVELKRKDRKGFEHDINRLRYCDERNDERVIKETYEKLFRYTKTLLWHVKPYKSQNVEPISGFYTRVKHLNGNLSLGKALERVYVLHDDPDQVLRELKGLLVVYHPDKNRHENAREIYEKVELIYKTVSAILKVHERHFGDTIFCNFKIFLGKKLKDIDENSVYEEIISTHKKLRMKEYLKKKEIIAKIRDEMLQQYRELIKLEDIVLAKKIDCPNPKQYIGAEGKESQLKREYKNQEEGIQKIYELKKDTMKKLESLSKKLRIEIEEILDICSTIKERCKNEIERESLVLDKSSFGKYYSRKKINDFKEMLGKLDNEQKEVEAFLARLKSKNFLSMLSNKDARGLFNVAKGGVMNPLDALKSGLKTVKELPSILSLETEYDYIKYYSELNEKYIKAIKEVEGYKVKKEKGGKLIFYEKVLKRQETDSPSDKVEFKVVDCNTKLEDLRSGNNKLNKKFKTQQELEREAKDNLLVTKDLKKKSVETKKEIEQLKNESEISERRAEEAEVRAEEERRAKEEERRAKEEERRAREKAEAKTKAIDLLYDEADDQDISRKKIKQNKDVQKFLECQYTFLVLNEGYTTKFKNLCREYKDLKREIKEPDFERLSKLANEFDRLSRSFIEGEKRENVPECRDGDIDRLKLSIVTRVIQARDVAEKEKRKVEKEKIEVEEIVKQLQIPNSAFSSVSHESVAGPSWWI